VLAISEDGGLWSFENQQLVNRGTFAGLASPAMIDARSVVTAAGVNPNDGCLGSTGLCGSGRAAWPPISLSSETQEWTTEPASGVLRTC
jgi:hypothetical protein